MASGIAVRPRPGTVERHDDDGGIVEIGIMRVAILEGPATGADVGPALGPVALHLELLQWQQPVEPAERRRFGFGAAGFEQRVRGERGIPHRRDTGLAIGLVILDDEQPLDRGPRRRARRIVRRPAECSEHHHAVGHCRIDRPEAILAVEPFLW